MSRTWGNEYIRAGALDAQASMLRGTMGDLSAVDIAYVLQRAGLPVTVNTGERPTPADFPTEDAIDRALRVVRHADGDRIEYVGTLDGYPVARIAIAPAWDVGDGPALLTLLLERSAGVRGSRPSPAATPRAPRLTVTTTEHPRPPRGRQRRPPTLGVVRGDRPQRGEAPRPA